jgi:uncharacterized membrane protein
MSMKCSSCATEFEGKFCPQCGAASQEADAQSQAQASAPPPSDSAPPPSQTPPAAAGGMDNNVAGALCYALWLFTGILFLVLAPYNTNKEIRFHAYQSIFVSLGLFVAGIAISILTMIATAVLGFIGSLFGMVGLLLWLAGFVLWIFLMLKTYQGQKVVLPIIGPLAEKQA